MITFWSLIGLQAFVSTLATLAPDGARERMNTATNRYVRAMAGTRLVVVMMMAAGALGRLP